MTEEGSLETFLKDVEEISEIVQGLNSSDSSHRENAFLQADKRLSLLKAEEDIEGTRIKTNRTVINKSPSANTVSSRPVINKSQMSQDTFLAQLENDAKERAQRRKEKENMANALKTLGNEAFVSGDYEAAVQHYTEGLDKMKDMQVLYTNRALAYIKLQKYQHAISDCAWALKCNEKCLKAYVHMGRAYVELKNYIEARKCYLKIPEIDSRQEKMAKDYLNQVDFQERKECEEQAARAEFDAGSEEAVSVVQLLQKLSRADQIELYYSGGIKFLNKAIKDCTGQTLFRTNNGFSIIGDNKVIKRCMFTTSADPVGTDLCLSVLNLWKTICNKNEVNQQIFISNPDTNKEIISLLSSEIPDIQFQTLALLSIFTMSERGSALMLKNIDPCSLLQSLLQYVTLRDGRANDAITILNCLTLEERLKIHFRTNFSCRSLISFVHLLSNVESCNREVLPHCIGIIGNLLEDQDIRKQAAEYVECWDACLLAMNKCTLPDSGDDYRYILLAVLGLMLNMSLEVTLAIKDRGEDICDRCISLLSSKDGTILTRCVGILSRVLPQCLLAAGQAVDRGLIKKMIKLLKAGRQRTSLYAVKVLAICTKENNQAREDVVKYDKKFSILRNFLSSEDEILVGNTALCLGNCFEIPGAASSLLQTDILKSLLTHASGNAKRTTVQQNAAIALGKLCTADSRFVNQLRELHGIEILNSCMKYIK
ncbi:tetratricopeptide repeat protein 12 [Bombina bombina]|uniref:tetratricopeptide repeat protein 12 n=1 Tax=Bombina bombina TaxID=8345 RepID=UPI00235A5B3B|nr:tetratricopeptide repeat protein 12 [Bombina bombina]